MTRRLLVLFAALAALAAGLSVYVLHLKAKVARDAQLAAQQDNAVAPVGNGPPQTVTLYMANDSEGTLRKTHTSVVLPPERTERDRAILRTLIAEYLKPDTPHAIGTGSEIRQVYLMGNDTAVVDTNPAFADAHPAGVLAEELTVASLVMTLNANDAQISRVKILVNGQERDTLAGHADLRRFYEASTVSQLVSELSVPKSPAVTWVPHPFARLWRKGGEGPISMLTRALVPQSLPRACRGVRGRLLAANLGSANLAGRNLP